MASRKLTMFFNESNFTWPILVSVFHLEIKLLINYFEQVYQKIKKKSHQQCCQDFSISNLVNLILTSNIFIYPIFKLIQNFVNVKISQSFTAIESQLSLIIIINKKCRKQTMVVFRKNNFMMSEIKTKTILVIQTLVRSRLSDLKQLWM